jgi:hypothetical protein
VHTLLCFQWPKVHERITYVFFLFRRHELSIQSAVLAGCNVCMEREHRKCRFVDCVFGWMSYSFSDLDMLFILSWEVYSRPLQTARIPASWWTRT